MTDLDKRIAAATESKIGSQLGAMTIELLRQQAIIDELRLEVAELTARIQAPAATNGADYATH